jgi:hypothetical protein
MCGFVLIHFPQEAPFARRAWCRFGGIFCRTIQLYFIYFVILGRQPVRVKNDPDAVDPPPTGTRTPPVIKKARGKMAKASTAPAPDAGVQNVHQQDATALLPPAPAPFQFTAGFFTFHRNHRHMSFQSF